MKKFVGMSLLAAMATLVVASIAVAANGDSGNDAPIGESIRPPWINADGTIDLQRMPDTIAAFGRDGQVCGWVSKSELFRDPTPQEEAAARERAARAPRQTTADANGGIHEATTAEPLPICQ